VVLADPADLVRARAVLAGSVDGLGRAVAVATTAELHAAATRQSAGGDDGPLVTLPDPQLSRPQGRCRRRSRPRQGRPEAEKRLAELYRRLAETRDAPICSAGSSTPTRRGARPARRARADAEQAITTAKQDLAGLGETVQRLRGERRQTQHALDMLAHQPHRRVRGRPRPQVSV
jgi:hypothetical protein